MKSSKLVILIAMLAGGCTHMSMNRAIRDGNIPKIKSILASGYDVNKTDAFLPSTPLMVAVGEGKFEIAQLLLDRGANLEAKDNRGLTALMYAVKLNIEMAKFLIDRGANVEAKDNGGATSLMHAARREFQDPASRPSKMMGLLIDRGADVNAKDNHGTTALMLAAGFHDLECVTLLIDHGADINAKNNQGPTAWIFALLSSYESQSKASPEIMSMLVNADTRYLSNAAFLFLPIKGIQLYEVVGGKDKLYEKIETIEFWPYTFGRIAVFQPGEYRLKASYGSSTHTETQLTTLAGKKIQFPFQAEGGRLYALYYELQGNTWNCWVGELQGVARPAAPIPLTLIDVLSVQRIEQDPPGLTRPGKLETDREYWLVSVTLENPSGQALELSAPNPQIYLSDQSGTNMSSVDLISPEKIEVLGGLAETFKSGLSSDFKFSFKVQPREKKTITIVFEVPKMSVEEGFKLHFLDSPPQPLKRATQRRPS